MSALPTLVSVDEYLHTAYRPDCDYVDGVVVERNVGEKSHAKLQQEILFYLRQRREQWGLFVIQEQRIQVSATRYRVPDVCVVAGPEPAEEIFTQPPFLCIEILSPEDRMGRMQEKSTTISRSESPTSGSSIRKRAKRGFILRISSSRCATAYSALQAPTSPSR
jgi:Uma2 family endonuclease